MGKRSKPSLEPEAKTAVAEADPPSPTVVTGLCEVHTTVTTGASLGEDDPSGDSSLADESHPTPPSNGGSTPRAEIPLNSSFDEPKAATVRVTDGKLPETESLVEDKARGDGGAKTKPTGAEERPTCKRKRPDQPFVPSKRQKTALLSPMEIEIQCLERMFAALSL